MGQKCLGSIPATEISPKASVCKARLKDGSLIPAPHPAEGRYGNAMLVPMGGQTIFHGFLPFFRLLQVSFAPDDHFQDLTNIAKEYTRGGHTAPL